MQRLRFSVDVQRRMGSRVCRGRRRVGEIGQRRSHARDRRRLLRLLVLVLLIKHCKPRRRSGDVGRGCCPRCIWHDLRGRRGAGFRAVGTSTRRSRPTSARRTNTNAQTLALVGRQPGGQRVPGRALLLVSVLVPLPPLPTQHVLVALTLHERCVLPVILDAVGRVRAPSVKVESRAAPTLALPLFYLVLLVAAGLFLVVGKLVIERPCARRSVLGRARRPCTCSATTSTEPRNDPCRTRGRRSTRICR